MLSREERILSELLLSRGLVSKDTLEACARKRDTSAASGSLVDALVESGDIERQEGERTAEEARALEASLEPELPGGGRLGEFRLIREIGRGGMGIVFEAEQETLRRRVALKVLPAGAALDERLSIRFLKEARAAARLNHPGIVPVYTSGRAQGVLYFAMEMIEGRSLADIVAAGVIPAERAARLAAEVARALDHAHREGLVHRDVKPENILIDASDRALVTDFGLVHEVAAGSFTLSHHVLGTPAFISPEQALGRTVDARSDVYSLGAVLYTMLAGQPPFAGEVPSVVLGRVLAGGPAPLERMRSELPADLVAIVDRAMARDPRERYPSALALAEDLERHMRGERIEAASRRAGGVEAAREEPNGIAASEERRAIGANEDPRARTVGSRLALAGLAILVIASVGAALLLRPRRGQVPEPSDTSAPAAARPAAVRASFTLLPSPPMRKLGPALSPDGSRLVYTSDESRDFNLYLLEAGRSEAIPLTRGSAFEDRDASFSPDGTQIAFTSGRSGPSSIHILDLATRRVRKMTDFGGSPAWSPDGREIAFTGAPASFGQSFRLWIVDVATGRTRLLKSIDTQAPSWSPHGTRIAFASQTGSQMDIWTLSHEGGEAIRITDDSALDWTPVWSPDGSFLYFGSDRDGSFNLWRIAIDETTGRTMGSAEPLAASAFAAPFELAMASKQGTMALIGADQPGRLHSLSYDPSAKTVHGPLAAIPRRYASTASADVSFDGRWLVFAAAAASENIAAMALESGAEPRLLTDDLPRDGAPRWSPDGSRIAFESDRGGSMSIWTMKADGTDFRKLGSAAVETAHSPVWSPDGRRIAYSVAGGGPRVARVDVDAPAETLPAPDGARSDPFFEPWSWSPDGETIAGTLGGVVVYATKDRRYRRLTTFGEKPVWIEEGRALLFVHERALYRIDARGGDPRIVFSSSPSGLSPVVGVTRDSRTLFVSLSSSAGEIWAVEPPP